MIFVEGGSFMMGDAGGKFIDEHRKEHYLERFTGSKNDEPAHEVILDSYSMQKHEVTYAEYDVYTRAMGKPLFKEDITAYHTTESDTPVSGINYFMSREYCQWLGKILGLDGDLPTEAQWEYAARSRGKNVPYATDTGYLEFGRNVVKDVHPYRFAPVGTYPPNPLGFESMTGNVMEWTKDEFDPTYYQKSPKHNPQGPDTGWPGKVVRGGERLGLRKTTIFSRYERDPNQIGQVLGFRCAINHSEPIRYEKLELTFN
jgi:formylglycine-generating enzyme required for sulfatase activity